jgi:hypothetical protein
MSLVKKNHLNSLPLGVKKESHMKWPTIGNEKKVIRVTPLEVKKIQFKWSRCCEKTFHLRGLATIFSF